MIEYSPLGGATIKGSKDKTEQLAKTLIGTIVTALAAYIISKTESTWEMPIGSKEKELFISSGRIPFAIKLGGTWYSYNRLGPIGFPIAIAAASKWYFSENPKSPPLPPFGLKQILTESEFGGLPPLLITLNTSKTAHFGDYDVTFAFTYSNGQDLFQDYQTAQFHITSWWERNEWWVSGSGAIVALASLLATSMPEFRKLFWLIFRKRPQQAPGKKH